MASRALERKTNPTHEMISVMKNVYLKRLISPPPPVECMHQQSVPF